jgi:hypothetical protein
MSGVRCRLSAFQMSLTSFIRGAASARMWVNKRGSDDRAYLLQLLPLFDRAKQMLVHATREAGPLCKVTSWGELDIRPTACNSPGGEKL